MAKEVLQMGLNLRTLRWGIILDYPIRLDLMMWVLNSREPLPAVVRKVNYRTMVRRAATLLALKMEEGGQEPRNIDSQ